MIQPVQLPEYAELCPHGPHLGVRRTTLLRRMRAIMLLEAESRARRNRGLSGPRPALRPGSALGVPAAHGRPATCGAAGLNGGGTPPRNCTAAGA